MARRLGKEATPTEIISWLAQEHSAVCGTPSGYRQKRRVIQRLKDLGHPEAIAMDDACREAWADLQVAHRAGERRGGRTTAEWIHGTHAGLARHYAQRSEERKAGRPVYALSPICPECKEAGKLARAGTEAAAWKPGPAKVRLRGEDAEHGTPERYSYEQLMKRRARAAGKPEPDYGCNCAAAELLRRSQAVVAKAQAALATTDG